MIDKFEQFNEKKNSKKASKFISKKIKYLMDKEDRPQKQAVAMAYSYAKKEGLLENEQLPLEFGKGEFSRAEVISMLEDLYCQVAESYNDYGRHAEDYIESARTFVAQYMEHK